MKVLANIEMTVEVDIDDEFRVLDVPLSKLTDCPTDMYVKCINAVKRALFEDDFVVRHNLDITYVESAETHNPMAEL